MFPLDLCLKDFHSSLFQMFGDMQQIDRSLSKAKKGKGGRKLDSGVSRVHDRTVRRVLNKYGYYYRLARRKVLLTESNLKLRIKFAKDITKYYDYGL